MVRKTVSLVMLFAFMANMAGCAALQCIPTC